MSLSFSFINNNKAVSLTQHSYSKVITSTEVKNPLSFSQSIYFTNHSTWPRRAGQPTFVPVAEGIPAKAATLVIFCWK